MHRVEQGTFKHEGYTLAYEIHGPADGIPVLLENEARTLTDEELGL